MDTDSESNNDVSLTNVLCTRCGLCCDGSLFADAELGRGESIGLEALGLEIEEGDGDQRAVLLQPCAALKGKRCSIYSHRPGCCRTFECRLLRHVKSGAISIERAKTKIAKALKEVARLKRLIGQLSERDERLPLKERFSEALAASDCLPDNPAIREKRMELKRAMTAVEKLIEQTFLAD
jgi:Fe-S-cluster containining protein